MSQVIAKAANATCYSQALPNDQALPGAVLLHHSTDLIELLSSSLSNWLGHQANVLDISIHIRGYKPGRRCIFELELILRSGERRRVIGKLYAHNQGAKAYETLQELWSHGFATGRFHVPQPIYYDPDWQLLLMHWASGNSLQELILNQLDVSRAVVQAAEWLVRLHTCGLAKGRRHDFNRYVRKPAFWRRYLKVVYPEAEPLFAEILNRIEGRARKLSGWSCAPSHHDYSADHLIIDNDQVTGVDFDEFCQYDPLFDVAHFVVQLRNLGLTRFGTLNRFDRLADVFQNTYKAYVKDYSVSRLQLYMTIAYLKLVHLNAFNQRAEDWRGIVDILLNEAAQETRGARSTFMKIA